MIKQLGDTLQKAVFIFPGQGTQFVGMGADLARDFLPAKEVFEEVDDALHQNLSALMFSGDPKELTQTQNAQPAIMAVSMAVFRVLKKMCPSFDKRVMAVAGHSLGEYSALCVAKVLSLSDVACLLRARGLAMAKACEEVQGGMIALLGANTNQAEEIASRSGVYVANDNAPGQIVLSGSVVNLEHAKELALQLGVRKVIPLPVMGAFHSPLMQSASFEMAPLLAQVKFKGPSVPIYFNITAKEEANPQMYADLLTRQIVGRVRWRELIQNTESSYFIECGAGNVLAGLVKRIIPSADVLSIGSTKEINNFIENLEK